MVKEAKIIFFVLLIAVLMLSASMFRKRGGEVSQMLENNAQSADSSGYHTVSAPNFLHELQIYDEKKLQDNTRVAILAHPIDSSVGIALLNETGAFEQWLPEGNMKSRDGGAIIQTRGPGEYLEKWFIEDINQDGMEEIAAQYAISGTAAVRPLYLYRRVAGSGEFTLLLKLAQGADKAEFVDLDHNGNKEILHSYALDSGGAGPRSWTRWQDVWGWKNGAYEKMNYKFPGIYENLILAYDELLDFPNPDSSLSSYYPTLECLKRRAQSNARGAFADAEACRRRE